MKHLFVKSLVALTLFAGSAQASGVSQADCYNDGVNGLGVTWIDMPGLSDSSPSTELSAALDAVGVCTQSNDVNFDFLGKIDDPNEGSEDDHQLVNTFGGIEITADYDFVSEGDDKYVELKSVDLPADTDWTLVGILFKGGNQDNHLYYDLGGLSLSILNDTLEKIVGNGRIKAVDVSHISLFGVQGVAAVPVPASLAFGITGLLGILVLGRRRKQ